MKYYKDITRLSFNLFDVKAWHLGESDKLKDWINFGFYNTIFVSVNGNVTVYYEKEECDKFYEILDEILDEELFNEVCDYLVELTMLDVNGHDEVFELSSKLWPCMTILDMVSRYPEYGNDSMIRRLIRLRKNTESFSYDLTKDVSGDWPENYIFYKGELIEGNFEEFVKERGIELISSE